MGHLDRALRWVNENSTGEMVLEFIPPAPAMNLSETIAMITKVFPGSVVLGDPTEQEERPPNPVLYVVRDNEISSCRYCGKPISWAKDAKTGKWIACASGYIGSHRCKGGTGNTTEGTDEAVLPTT